MSKKNIEIFPYDPNWPVQASHEADLLKQALKDECIAVHHIGSTAVPTLVAKRDLDLICVVKNLKGSLKIQELGYVFKGELNIPLRYYFSKNTEKSKVNLHVCEQDHGFITLNLTFRDYLRSHPKELEKYALLKQNLVANPASHHKEKGSFSIYNLEKDHFIKKTLQKAGFNDLMINFCMHHNEWEMYHKMRKSLIFDPNQVEYDTNHSTIYADDHFHMVLYQGTQIVGLAHIELLDHFEAVLRSFAIDPSVKSEDLSVFLLQRIEKWLLNLGYSSIKTHAPITLAPFLKEHGYFEIQFDDPTVWKSFVNLGKNLDKAT